MTEEVQERTKLQMITDTNTKSSSQHEPFKYDRNLPRLLSINNRSILNFF